jgi:rare lipoprotein A
MAPGQTQVGKASWYGAAFHGRRTANGEIYDMASITAAHPTMPLPSYARVTNLENGRSIIVRVNDRGPYHGGRVMDLSSRAADALDTKRMGTAAVKVEYMGDASLAGSDDSKLMASLRTDGRPATLDGLPNAPQTMVAEAAPAAVPNFLSRFSQSPAPSAPPAAPLSPPAPPLAQVASLRPTAMPSKAPLPPSRPFDLGTIPGAGVPIAPSPKLRQAFATFYAPHRDPIAATLAREGAFDSVARMEKTQRFMR